MRTTTGRFYATMPVRLCVVCAKDLVVTTRERSKICWSSMTKLNLRIIFRRLRCKVKPCINLTDVACTSCQVRPRLQKDSSRTFQRLRAPNVRCTFHFNVQRHFAFCRIEDLPVRLIVFQPASSRGYPCWSLVPFAFLFSLISCVWQ